MLRSQRWWTAMGRTVAVAAVGIFALPGWVVGGDVVVGDEPQFREPVWGPDVYGGYASYHIVVKLHQNLQNPAAAVLSPAFEALRTKWDVLSIEPVYPYEFVNKALAAQYGLDRSYLLAVPIGSDTPTMAAEFAALKDDVESATVDGIGGVALIPNDTDFSLLYGMHNTGQTGGVPDADIDAPEAWDLHTGDFGTVTVAVVDSGVSPHVELGDRLIEGTNTNQPGGPTTDGCPHGTHVSGTVAATGNNGIGVAGVTWGAFIMPVRVLNNCNGTEVQCANGIIWAAEHGADICTMSLQYYNFVQFFEDGVNFAWDEGVLLIAATGNGQGNNVAWPAKFEKCMGVGATTDDDTIAGFSNWGPEVDVSAAGDNVWSISTPPDPPYTFKSGTSMAAPHVAGLLLFGVIGSDGFACGDP
ncbi:MAG: S8 family serine peptidase, partial [Gemmatimonadetes bacterium]|nr:S8 family serine peptidase [Gemmatimonadota bacterium]